jgi:hypothetical protein
MELDRLMSRNKYTKDEALSRIRAQMSVEEKKSRADILIDNSRSLSETEEQVQTALRDLENKSSQSKLYRWMVFGLGFGPALFAFLSLTGLLCAYALYVRFFIQPTVMTKHFPVQKKSK